MASWEYSLEEYPGYGLPGWLNKNRVGSKDLKARFKIK